MSYFSDGFVLFNSRNKTELSSRTLFPLFAAKTSSRIFDGFCKFSNKVAIPESKCLFAGRNKSTKIDDRKGNRYTTRYFSILINRLVKIIDKYR